MNQYPKFTDLEISYGGIEDSRRHITSFQKTNYLTGKNVVNIILSTFPEAELFGGAIRDLILNQHLLSNSIEIKKKDYYDHLKENITHLSSLINQRTCLNIIQDAALLLPEELENLCIVPNDWDIFVPSIEMQTKVVELIKTNYPHTQSYQSYNKKYPSHLQVMRVKLPSLVIQSPSFKNPKILSYILLDIVCPLESNQNIKDFDLDMDVNCLALKGSINLDYVYIRDCKQKTKLASLEAIRHSIRRQQFSYMKPSSTMERDLYRFYSLISRGWKCVEWDTYIMRLEEAKYKHTFQDFCFFCNQSLKEHTIHINFPIIFERLDFMEDSNLEVAHLLCYMKMIPEEYSKMKENLQDDTDQNDDNKIDEEQEELELDEQQEEEKQEEEVEEQEKEEEQDQEQEQKENNEKKTEDKEYYKERQLRAQLEYQYINSEQLNLESNLPYNNLEKMEEKEQQHQILKKEENSSTIKIMSPLSSTCSDVDNFPQLDFDLINEWIVQAQTNENTPSNI